jgi:hypothetical protein
MMIVDGQIHLWEKGTPSAHHRQEPYLAEQAIAGMDAAGVDPALVHPVLAFLDTVRTERFDHVRSLQARLSRLAMAA